MTRSLPTLTASAALLLAATSAALADRYHLNDGSTLEASLIGEADGVVEVLDHEGRERKLPRASIASVESGAALPERYAPKLARCQRFFLDGRRRDAKRLIKRYRRAKPDERAKISAALDAFAPRLLEGPLGDALEDDKTRELALARLKATQGPPGIRPLVRAAITSKDKGLREATHAAAVAADPTLTRTYYEQIVALPTAPKRRMRALANLAGMGDRAAIPGLIYALEKVETEIKTSLATAGGLRRVPVNLGTQGGAAVNAPIELPEQNLTAVQTKVSVSTLRQVASGIQKVLGGLSGADRKGAKAWKTWWDEQPTSYRK